jgi:hypothetical protein
MTEVLEVIKETGGVKKFKELAQAITLPEAEKLELRRLFADIALCPAIRNKALPRSCLRRALCVYLSHFVVEMKVAYAIIVLISGSRFAVNHRKTA